MVVWARSEATRLKDIVEDPSGERLTSDETSVALEFLRLYAGRHDLLPAGTAGGCHNR